jgi:MFS family permease
MIFERNIKLLRWHSFFVDFSLWAPLAIIYFANVSGSYTLGLSIFSITMLSSAAFELPTGFLSDKYGRVKTIIFGSLSFFIGAIFYAIGLNYWFLVLGAIAQGLGRAFYSGNNDALLYDNLASVDKIDEFSEFNGKIGSMSQLALAISAGFSALVAFFPISFLLWISTIPQLICLILSLELVEVEIIDKEIGNIFIHIKESFKNFISNFKLRQLSLVSIISFGMGEAGWYFRSAFINTIWPTWAVGFAQVLSNIGATISFKFSGKIIKKYSAIKALVVDQIYSKSIDFISLLFPGVWSPGLMSSTSLGYGVSCVAENKLLQTEFTHKQRATMGSLNSLFSSLFFAIFAVILGILADRYGVRNALLIQTVLSCIIFIPFYRFYKADHVK